MVSRSQISPLSVNESDSLVEILNNVKGSTFIKDLVNKHVSNKIY